MQTANSQNNHQAHRHNDNTNKNQTTNHQAHRRNDNINKQPDHQAHRRTYCTHCGDHIPTRRAVLGYTTCLLCGEEQARMVRHCVAPINKSNYMLFTDPSLLKQLNPKRTT